MHHCEPVSNLHRITRRFADAVALPLTLTLLVFYSAKLTLVVLSFSLAIAVIIAIMVPTFRKHLENLHQAEGTRQGHLVETICGMRTVKSLALEPVGMETWNNSVALGVRRRAAVGKMSAAANVLTHALDKFVRISVLGLGCL